MIKAIILIVSAFYVIGALIAFDHQTKITHQTDECEQRGGLLVKTHLGYRCFDPKALR